MLVVQYQGSDVVNLYSSLALKGIGLLLIMYCLVELQSFAGTSLELESMFYYVIGVFCFWGLTILALLDIKEILTKTLRSNKL
jgi:hypothetical protein